MSEIDIEKLLQPVEEETPGGEDLEYDADFMSLEQDIEGSAELQMGDAIIEAEEPNWKDIQQRAENLLARTHDLRLLIFLIRAGIRNDGFHALANGLTVLQGWIETFWDSLFPALDPDDDNDPTERINILMALCDFEIMLKPVSCIPVVESRALGRFSLLDIRRSEDTDSEEDEERVAPATIAAAFKDAELDALQRNADALKTCAEKIDQIENQVTERVGVENAASFAPFRDLIKEIQDILTEQISERGGGDATDGAQAETSHGVTGEEGQKLRGEIRTSQDVIHAIEKICDYYRKNEPSSPVPILLERAKRLVNMDFLSIVKDLASEGVSQVETFIGAPEDDDDDY